MDLIIVVAFLVIVTMVIPVFDIITLPITIVLAKVFNNPFFTGVAVEIILTIVKYIVILLIFSQGFNFATDMKTAIYIYSAIYLALFLLPRYISRGGSSAMFSGGYIIGAIIGNIALMLS